jgi:hypothetical protein
MQCWFNLRESYAIYYWKLLERVCWKDDITEDKKKLISFPEQDVEAACVALGSNLEPGDLAAWIEVDAETLVMQHLTEEEVAAYVKNGKTCDELGVSDSRSGSENSSDYSCEVVVYQHCAKC